MELKDILSIAISVCAGIFSLFIYISHTRKINRLQIRSMENNEEEKKKANIICEVIPYTEYGKSLNCIRITNIGKASAFNVDFECKDENVEFRIDNKLFPYPKIIPGQNIDVYYYSFSEKPHQTFIFTWDDEFCMNEQIEQVVSL